MKVMQLHSTTKVAKSFGVSQRTVARWCREDKLPYPFYAVKLGRLWRIGVKKN